MLTTAERLELLKLLGQPALELDLHTADFSRRLMIPLIREFTELEAASVSDKDRTAIRRLIANGERLLVLFKWMKPYLYEGVYHDYRKRVNKLLERALPIYQLDSMVNELMLYGQSVGRRSETAAIVAVIDARRLICHSAFSELLTGEKHLEFATDLIQFLREPLASAFDFALTEPDEQKMAGFRYRLPLLIQEPLLGVYCYNSTLEQLQDHERLNGLLKRFTHFEASLSLLTPFLGSSTQEYHRPMSALQDALMHLSEAHYAIHWLIHLPRASLDQEQIALLKEYRQTLTTRRERHYQTFHAAWRNFFTLETQKHGALAQLCIY
ncbi:MAG: CHAD domain-containing protein [Phototrophicaceae bacterium]